MYRGSKWRRLSFAPRMSRAQNPVPWRRVGFFEGCPSNEVRYRTMNDGASDGEAGPPAAWSSSLVAGSAVAIP
jgi:hypothetical protein